MTPLPLDPEQLKHDELPLADIDFLKEMESRSSAIAADLMHARHSIDRIGSQLGVLGIATDTTTRVLFKETFDAARETGARLGLDVRCSQHREITMSAIVGNSRKRQDLAPYRALVELKAGRFRAARAHARRCVRLSGEWPLGVSLFSLTVSGECAIAALRVAGFLRACRIVEIIDVTGHAARLDGLAKELEALTC